MVRFALLSLALAVIGSDRVVAQASYTWGGSTGGNWLTPGNWSGGPAGTIPGTYPGGPHNGNPNDIAQFANTATNVGIDMDTAGGAFQLGALSVTGSTALQVGNSSATNGVLTLNGATVNGVSNTLASAGGADLTLANVNSGAGSQTMGLRLGVVNGVFQTAGSRTLTVSSVISEATTGSSVTKTGAGTLTLNGANTFTGGVTFNSGTLSLGNNAALGTGALTVGAINTTINVTGTAATFANDIALTAPAGQVTFATPTDSSTTLSGVISGGVANTNIATASGTEWLFRGPSGSKTNALTITGNNVNWMGTLTVSHGPLILGNANAAGTTVIRLGSNLPPAGALQLAGNFTIANSVFLTSATAQAIGVGSGLSAGISGVIASDATTGLAKVGVGTLALSGANTYTGVTNVTAGSLLVNGNSSGATGAVTVQTGGTLGGTGTVGGATTVQSGGAIRGGTAATTGTLTTGNVTVNTDATLAANLAAPGTSSTLAVGGNTLNLLNGSKLSLTAITGFSGAAGSYTLATLTNGDNLQLGGTGNRADGFSFGTYVEGTGASGAVVIDVSNLSFTLNAGDTFALNRVGNNLVLSFSPVPEPATVLAVGAAGLGLFGWARRRRQATATA